MTDVVHSICVARGTLNHNSKFKYLLHHSLPTGPWASNNVFELVSLSMGFPGGTSGKESTCQCRSRKRHRFELSPYKSNIFIGHKKLCL